MHHRGTGDPTSEATAGPSSTVIAPGAGSAPSLPTGAFDARYVNDNAGEVDSADVVDGSLTGADVSTSGGDVTFAEGEVSVRGAMNAASDDRGTLRVRPYGAGSSGDAQLVLQTDGAGAGISFYMDDDSNSLQVRRTNDGGASTGVTYMTVRRSNGNVGIGTTTPGTALEVQGGGMAGVVTVGAGSGAVDGSAELRLEESDDGVDGMRVRYDGAEDHLEIRGKTMSGVTTPHFVVQRDSGHVGIGRTYPDAGLHVTTVGVDALGLTSGLDYFVALFKNTLTAEQASAIGIDAASGQDARLYLGHAGTAKWAVGNDSQNQNNFEIQKVTGGVHAPVFTITSGGETQVDTLRINGGSDLVEGFDTDRDYEPGTVLVIDATLPGRLVQSQRPYDARVAAWSRGLAVSGRVYTWPGRRARRRDAGRDDRPRVRAMLGGERADPSRGSLDDGSAARSRDAGHRDDTVSRRSDREGHVDARRRHGPRSGLGQLAVGLA